MVVGLAGAEAGCYINCEATHCVARPDGYPGLSDTLAVPEVPEALVYTLHSVNRIRCPARGLRC